MFRRVRSGLLPAAKRGQRAWAMGRGGSGCLHDCLTCPSCPGCGGQPDLPAGLQQVASSRCWVLGPRDAQKSPECAKRKERAGLGSTRAVMDTQALDLGGGQRERTGQWDKG